MKRSKLIAASALLGVLALVVACAGNTKFVSSWLDPAFQKGSVKKVFVVGVSRNAPLRRSFESSFVSALAGHKVTATPSFEVYPDLDLTKIDRDAAAKKLRDEGYTHVLVSRLVDQKTVQSYVPATVMVSGGAAWPGYYGGWYPYMSTTYVASPGYSVTEEVYSIETNLYDLSKEGVAWSGLTQTTVSAAAESEIHSMIQAVAYEMRSKQVI